MILADQPKTQVDGIFFHARSFKGDDDGLFELAGELVRGVSNNAVVINGGNGGGVAEGSIVWPGKDEYTERLRSFGCNVHVAPSGRHTLEEAIAFSEFAQKMSWKRVIVIGQPLQLLRIMLTHLHVMKKRNYPMQMYAMAPHYVDWNKSTNSNQCEPPKPRFDQIEGEFNRLMPYHEQGNLATIPELIEYMVRERSVL